MDVYKVHCLDANGMLEKIYVYAGSSDFSIPELDALGVPVIYTNQQIHPDDSIRIIKNKIVHAIGENVISYNELYLFMDVAKRINLMEIYQHITNNWRSDFTREHLVQLLHNLNIPIDANPENKTTYEYEEVLGIVGNEYTVKVPIGQKFSQFQNYLFSVDPYHIDKAILYQPTKKNILTVFDNMLLLNYGSPINNTITVCFAGNVLGHIQNKETVDTLESSLIQTYFPFLYLENHIETLEQLELKKEAILKLAKSKVDKQAFDYYKTIDMFYNVFKERTSDLKYIERGIQSFSIMMNTGLNAKLPLEIIFKNIHSTETIPFIKYNPGSMRENLYRLFANKLSKNGKKIPFLSEQEIMRLSRKIGKGNQISMAIKMVAISEEIYIDFMETGNIQIYGDLSVPILPSELNTLVRDAVNPVIHTINEFLQKSGYSLKLFSDIHDDNVVVLNMKYIARMMIEEELTNLQKYIKCLSSLFVIYQPNISKVAKMVFKRVENFKETDAKTIFIQGLYNKTDNAELIIKGIMDNFQVPNEEAIKILGKYLETIAQQQPGEEMVDVPGFQTLIYNDKEENHIVIEVDNIVHIEYIRILHMYIDSFLRITQHPTTTNVAKKDIDQICKSVSKFVNVDKTHIENQVVAVAVAPGPGAEAPLGLADVIEPVAEEAKGELAEEGDYEDIVNDLGKPEAEILQEDDDFFRDAQPLEEDLDDDDALFYGDEDEEEADELFKGGGRKKKVQNIITNDVLLNDLMDEGENNEEKAPGEPYRVELAGLSLHNPNIFERRMQKREPFLFTTKSGKFTNYSTLCQSAAKKQPIILTDEEKAKIDENDKKYGKGERSYKHAIKMGTDPNKKFWYICPRYWCLQTNMAMTEQEVKEGKCGTKPYPHNIIPDDADVVPEGAYVIEFKSKKHVKADGTYIYHNPAVLSKKTADGHCLPCCYSGWRSGLWDKNMETCPEAEPDDADEPTDKDGNPIGDKDEPRAKPAKQENYIVGIDKINIGPGRWGLLPFSVQAFLREDSTKCVAKAEMMEKEKEKENAAKPTGKKAKKEAATAAQAPFDKEDVCLLRYGVEKHNTQSFLGAVAFMYAYKQQLEKIPSISEMKTILAKTINLDHFVKSFNGSLISTFKPEKIDVGEIDYNQPFITSSEFYKEIIDQSDERQMDLLENVIAAFENFLRFLRDDAIEIDYTYLWDIATEPDDKLMKDGYNLIILEMPKDDLRDNIQIVCPTHSSSNVLYDPAKDTVIMLKQSNKTGTYYEMICGYAKKEINIVRVFREDNTPENLKYILGVIKNTTNKYCQPLPGLPKQYNFKKNIGAMEVGNILKSVHYFIEYQVLNYQSKVVGLIVNKHGEEGGEGEEASRPIPSTYIPCYPSSIMSGIPHKWMDDDRLWQDYETTRNSLLAIHMETDGKILCSPKMKLLDDKMIVGIITETNQMVPISPISENIFDDGLIAVDNHNYVVKEAKEKDASSPNIDDIHRISYLQSDIAITTLNDNDSIRQSIVSNIDLETRYYTFFRSIIRKLLIEYDNRHIRRELLETLDNIDLTYREKLDNVVVLLHTLVGNRVIFANMDEKTLENIQQQCMNMSGNGRMTCFTDDEAGQVMIPNTHLIGSRLSNEKIYYGRMADELIRYTRIKLFMLSSAAYLNIGNSEYVIYDNELLLLQSLLNADYFKDIVAFNDNQYLQNIDYQNAIPLFSQKYQTQPITVDEQRKLDTESESEQVFDINMEYVREKLKNVQGHPTKSLWGRLFHTTADEYRFYSTPRSGFYMLVYIFTQVLRNLGQPAEVYTIDNIKDVLLRAYGLYFAKPGYREKIMAILQFQGKSKLFKGNATFEQVVKSDAYYVTDLDIWVISNAFSLPIVLFSSTSLKSLYYQKIDWLLLGGNPQVDTYYFVRSPAKSAEMEYQLILPGVKLTDAHMSRFYSLYQAEAIQSPSKAKSLYLQSLDDYLSQYHIGPVKKI